MPEGLGNENFLLTYVDEEDLETYDVETTENNLHAKFTTSSEKTAAEGMVQLTETSFNPMLNNYSIPNISSPVQISLDNSHFPNKALALHNGSEENTITLSDEYDTSVRYNKDVMKIAAEHDYHSKHYESFTHKKDLNLKVEF